MSKLISLFGNLKGITEINNSPSYKVGTVILKDLPHHSYKKFIVVSNEIEEDHFGQRCIAEDISMQSYVSSTYEKENGGRSIGSFKVIPDEMYNQKQVDELINSWNDKQKIELTAKGKKIFEAARPEWAVTILLATLEEDKSDSREDSSRSSTKRKVILAWSRHTRNDFSEMRKAAAKFEGTKYLTEGENLADYEHRDNYAGGRGCYLAKDTYSGWQVKKQHLKYNLDDLYYIAAHPENFLVGDMKPLR